MLYQPKNDDLLFTFFGISKAEGDAPVQAYIAAMPGWKRDVGRRLDAPSSCATRSPCARR
jgi:hypothetical protein